MNSALKWLIPEEFRPLLACVSPSAFKVVQWQAVLAEAPVLSKRALHREGVQEVAQGLKAILPDSIKFDLLGAQAAPMLLTGLGPHLLEIYFGQLFGPGGLFLDLRSRRFSKAGESAFRFHPNGLWVQLKPEFRLGMIEIYEGFYLEKPELMRTGLLKVGLIRSDFSQEKANAVESMLLSHIGGEATAQEFRVA
ncbi:MAG: hypothetical protein K2X47_09755, partial [Bdellovibrionales bacterium]|nr:hypothetical protein [Bdellovibrionales bacterium]